MRILQLMSAATLLTLSLQSSADARIILRDTSAIGTCTVDKPPYVIVYSATFTYQDSFTWGTCNMSSVSYVNGAVVGTHSSSSPIGTYQWCEDTLSSVCPNGWTPLG